MSMTIMIPPAVRAVVDAIVAAGGRPVITGGAVRDHFLGFVPKDFDIETFGLSADVLAAAFSAFKVDAVGRAFGVLKVTVDGETVDVSLPRRESKDGHGHRGFIVTPDPNMSYAEAALRRDFTINSMGYDPCADVFLDPFDGQKDMKEGVLRHTSKAFAEDPLRVLRGCQFAARFGFTFAPETVEMCRSLVPELATLPKERLWEEWKKLLTKGEKPSVGLDALVETGAIEIFPEVKALLHVPQEPEWHPEGEHHPLGSLWIHNGMVTDSAVRVLRDDGVTDPEERLLVILGAFCHDFGKPSTTEVVGGRIRSLKHEEAGEAPTRSFLERIGAPPAVIDAVVPLVMDHLKPFHLARDQASPGAVRRLAMRVPIERLCRVARADFVGRTTADALACTDTREIAETKWLVARATEMAIKDSAPQPLLMGRHLIDIGLKPGKEMGLLLKQAFEQQLDGTFTDEVGAIAWAKEKVSV